MQPNNKWLVFGHYGGHNTGDEAMLVGLFTPLSVEESKFFTVVYKGSLPSNLKERGVKSVQPNILQVIYEIIYCHGIIIGGGTHFHDDYVLIRYFRHLRYMVRLSGVSVIAKLFQKKVLWLSMGFGPFNRILSRWITKIGLNNCDFITLRDSTSKEIISKWLPPEKMALSFDLAALLLTDTILDDVRDPNYHLQDNLTIGISVTSVKMSKTGGVVVDKEFWNLFQKTLLSLLDEIDNIYIRFFIFRGGNRENDVDISYSLYQSLAATFPSRVGILPYNPNPQDILKEISMCQRFIATRFHSGILSFLAGCEILFLAYHQKINDLALEIGLPSQSIINIKDDISETQIREKVESLIRSPEKYRPTLNLDDALSRAMVNIDTIELFN